MRQTTVMGSFMGTRDELLSAAKWLGEGRILAVIDSVLPLQDVRTAHERMLERKLFGKIVLTP
jgi:zinc-binding alcohol dehydrogenase/oxidoreductase